MPLLLLLLLSAAPMTFDDLIKPAWKATPSPKTTVFWEYRVAPALPSEWPMTKTSTVVRWVYAAGRDLDLHDGERVAGPWAGIDLPLEGTPTLSRVSSSLELVGTQGIRPISKAEAEAVKLLTDAEVALRANDLIAIRPGFCAWRSMNGVIAKQLEPRHAAFFAALACDRR